MRKYSLRSFQFSEIELRHLSIGTLLFTGVMLSFFVYDYLLNPTTETLFRITLLTILTVPLFVVHELGHKFSAQKFNLWAEFRLDPQGALFTAISIILPFKFVAPGAVMIRANDYTEVPAMGKVAGFGPGINLFLGGLYLIITGIFTVISSYTNMNYVLFASVFFYASGFSFFLGVFNMLPFGPLDGKKVKFWNETAFWTLFSLTALLSVETYINAFFFGNDNFLLGSIIANINIDLGLFYPLILGIVIFSISVYLLVKLQDPSWNPGVQKEVFDDYQQYYYRPAKEVRINKSSTTHSSSAPMNTPCAECGKKDLLPFRCTTCNKIYCAEHRLPGRHFCVQDV